MPTFTGQIVADADDSYSDASNGFYYNYSTAQLGLISGNKRIMYLRFTNVQIGQGSNIDSATLSVRAGDDNSGDLIVRIFGNDADDAVAPTNITQANALVRTTAYNDWTVPAFTSGNDYSTSIKDAIQEVINRPGWVSGNDIQLILECQTASGTSYRVVNHYTTTPPSISIIYSIPTKVYPNAEGLEISAVVPSFSPFFQSAPFASLIIEAIPPALPGTTIEISNILDVELGVIVPAYVMAPLPPEASIEIAAINPYYVWDLNAKARPAAQTIYICTLTGDGESPVLEDLTLPMSSFQGRMRDGGESYVSCVIPNAPAYSADIAARQNGDIVIRKGYRFQDGTTQLEEIARVDFESLRIDKGSRSASATLSGHRTTSATTSKPITVQGVSYYCLQADGKRRIRALLDLFLRIGDTCIYGTGGGDWLIVGYISYTVSTELTIMEVTEA